MRRCRADARRCPPLVTSSSEACGLGGFRSSEEYSARPIQRRQQLLKQPDLLHVVQQPGTAVALAEESMVEDRVEDATEAAGNPQHQRRVVLRAVALSC